jgi:hypothetical protein
LLWFAVTLVWPMVSGAPVDPLVGLYGGADASEILRMGLGAFVAGAIPIVILSVLLSGMFYARFKSRAGA